VGVALERFDRVVALRAGRVVFDAPAAAVDADMLAGLYALEPSPVTGVRLPAPVLARRVPAPSRTAALALVLVAVAAAAAAAGAGSGEVVNPGGWAQVRAFLGGAIRPRMDAAFLSLTADAALTTLAFAAVGTALSLVLGMAGGVLASRFWWRRRGPWLAVRAALAVPRGMHEVVWGLLLLAVVGLDPLVAVLAIGLPYGAVTAKVVSEISTRPIRARPVACRRRAPAGWPRRCTDACRSPAAT
jgi:phosphonate transport system permease protein